jgi:hypothetical protein
MSDRDDLLATMYDDEVVVPVAPLDVTPGTRKIRVGIAEYEVPTVEYVRQLEQLLTQQSHMITQLRHAMHRMESLHHGTRSYVRRYGDAIGDIRAQLLRKVDHS